MATTQKGTYYPSDYSKIADVPADMKKMAESIDKQTDNLVQKEEGKGLSSNDFTNELKTKLNNLENYDDTEVKQDISNLDTNKASKAELQEATIALQAELKATRKDLEYGTLEGEDAGESLYLQDSSDARFRSFEISGNSKRETREGYNLINIKNNSYNKDGCIESQTDKEIILKPVLDYIYEQCIYFKDVLLETKKTYTLKAVLEVLSGTPFAGTGQLELYKGSVWVKVLATGLNGANNYNKNVTFSVDETSTYRIRFKIADANSVTEIFRVKLSELMIYEGTADKQYEQYGAMPSLEFPREIEAVGQDVNIFDKDSAVKGVMFTATGEVQNDKYFTSDYIKVKKNTDYYTNEYAPVVKAFDINKNQIGYLRNVATAGTFNTGNAEYIKSRNSIQFETEEQMQNAIDNAKIVKGTEINGYSPYNCGSANVVIENKDKLDFSKWSNATASHGTIEQVENGIKLTATANDCYTDTFAYKFQGTLNKDKIEYYGIIAKPNAGYTFSCKVNDITKSKRLSMFFSDKDYNAISYVTSATSVLTATAPENCKYITVRVGVVNTGDSLTFTDLQVEEGNATEYVEHEEQTLAMPVQQEMLEEDTFDLDNEEEVHTWGKYVFTGEESISKSGITNNNSFWMNSNFLPNLLNAEILNYTATDSITPNVLCTHLKTLKPVLIVSYDNEGITICANDNNLTDITIRFGFGKSSEINTADKCKAWLKQQYEAGTPVTVYYKLKTPTKLPFTASQKAVAKQIREILHSYKGGTHVYSVDEISPIFNVRYTLDQKAYIDAQLKPIIQELTGGN